MYFSLDEIICPMRRIFEESTARISSHRFNSLHVSQKMSKVCIVGETICSDSAQERFLRGYNTHCGPHGSSPSIFAAVSGAVEVTESVLSVRGRSPRYLPEIGDVVVGRIIEVAGNRWRIDIGGMQDAVMLLANVTEPGGMLRRRGRADELTMRKIFAEDDVVVAEVQRVTPDGLAFLHTRSAAKYGRVRVLGSLVTVGPSTIRRVRHQFHTFRKLCVSVVAGVNGYVWVGAATAEQLAEAQAQRDTAAAESGDEDSDEEHADDSYVVDPNDRTEVHRAVARVANCVQVLGQGHVPVYPKSIYEAVRSSISHGWKPYDLLLPENRAPLIIEVQPMTVSTVARRRKRTRDE
jgi:exosome complex component RRP4